MNIDMQRLERVNQGTSFFNIGERYEGKKFFVYVLLEIKQDLTERKEEIKIETNLPLRRDSYYWERVFSVKDFFEKLKEFSQFPLGKLILPPKAQISSWELGELKGNLRDETIGFDDINIQVGELADEKLKEQGINNFCLEVEKIIKKQSGSLEHQEKVNAYIRLREKIENLKNLFVGKREDYGYSYSKKEEDKTIKLPLTPEEYNAKLKEIEKDLRTLEKTLHLREFDMPYKEIKEEKTFEVWLKENEEQLREDFENGSSEEDGEEMTFDEYAEMVFNQGEE